MAADLAAELTPESQAARDSDLLRLGRLTARLSEREQELIALKYGAALNNREIARLTGLSESNVGTAVVSNRSDAAFAMVTTGKRTMSDNS